MNLVIYFICHKTEYELTDCQFIEWEDEKTIIDLFFIVYFAGLAFSFPLLEIVFSKKAGTTGEASRKSPRERGN